MGNAIDNFVILKRQYDVKEKNLLFYKRGWEANITAQVRKGDEPYGNMFILKYAFFAEIMQENELKKHMERGITDKTLYIEVEVPPQKINGFPVIEKNDVIFKSSPILDDEDLRIYFCTNLNEFGVKHNLGVEDREEWYKIITTNMPDRCFKKFTSTNRAVYLI